MVKSNHPRTGLPHTRERSPLHITDNRQSNRSKFPADIRSLHISITHVPVPVPISKILFGFVNGAKNSLPPIASFIISYCTSNRSISTCNRVEISNPHSKEGPSSWSVSYLIIRIVVCWTSRERQHRFQDRTLHASQIFGLHPSRNL